MIQLDQHISFQNGLGSKSLFVSPVSPHEKNTPVRPGWVGRIRVVFSPASSVVC